MIPVGQPYRASGSLDPRSVLCMIILGAFTAVFSAGLIWLWEISPIPTLVIITAIIQGLIVGAALSYMVGRLRLRSPRLVGVIGFACGLFSVVLLHYGHHLRIVSEAAGAIRTQITRDADLTPEKKRQLFALLDVRPSAFVDPWLVEQTGHPGFVGTMLLRNQHGVTIKGHKTAGLFLWLIWGGEALFVAITAATMGASRAGEPYCEECAAWCASQPDLLVLPGAATAPLTEAIREDNPSRVAEIRARPPEEDGTGLVGVSLKYCPFCDQSFADASHRVSTGKETKVTTLLTRLRVSPEMVAVLRAGPEEFAPRDEPEEGHEDEEAPVLDGTE